VWMSSSAGIQSFRFDQPFALPLPRRLRPPDWAAQARMALPDGAPARDARAGSDP
jgi:hypothetical protein